MRGEPARLEGGQEPITGFGLPRGAAGDPCHRRTTARVRFVTVSEKGRFGLPRGVTGDQRETTNGRPDKRVQNQRETTIKIAKVLRRRPYFKKKWSPVGFARVCQVSRWWSPVGLPWRVRGRGPHAHEKRLRTYVYADNRRVSHAPDSHPPGVDVFCRR